MVMAEDQAISRPWKPSREQIQAAFGQRVPDLIAPGLKVLFSGINPSLYSAAVGHHFARPGNRFWPSLHASGFTPRLFSPFDGASLVELGYGITNLVARATSTAAELQVEEFVEGGRGLEAKVLENSPRFVAFLGITAYRSAFGRADAVVGLQRERIGPSQLWVLPNPSGLNAHYQREDLKRLFMELRVASEAHEIAD